jgi:carboxypeptidase Taq
VERPVRGGFRGGRRPALQRDAAGRALVGGAVRVFPDLQLGNVYAGVLHEALRADLPDLDASLAKGDPSPATAWLGERLQRFGGLREPRATIEHAAGRKVSEAPLLDYLDAKFGAIYGV